MKRLFQFPWLLVVVTLLAVMLTAGFFILKKPIEQRLAIQRLSKTYVVIEEGGLVTITAIRTTPKIDFEDMNGISKDMCLNISGRMIDDHDIFGVSKGPKFKTLIFDYCPNIRGRFLADFSPENSPEELRMMSTSLSDDTVVGLANLPIQRLEISCTTVSDLSIPVFASMLKLKHLYVDQCCFSDEGIKKLRLVVPPNCTVYPGHQRR